jgi:replication-associated recombination protein RarA
METTPHRVDILQNILSSAQPNERVYLQKQIAQMTPQDFDRMYSATGGDIREMIAGLSLAHSVEEVSLQIEYFDVLQSSARTLVRTQRQSQENTMKKEDENSALQDLLTL